MKIKKKKKNGSPMRDTSPDPLMIKCCLKLLLLQLTSGDHEIYLADISCIIRMFYHPNVQSESNGPFKLLASLPELVRTGRLVIFWTRVASKHIPTRLLRCQTRYHSQTSEDSFEFEKVHTDMEQEISISATNRFMEFEISSCLYSETGIAKMLFSSLTFQSVGDRTFILALVTQLHRRDLLELGHGLQNHKTQTKGLKTSSEISLPSTTNNPRCDRRLSVIQGPLPLFLVFP